MEPMLLGPQPGERQLSHANDDELSHANENIPTSRDLEYENALRYVRRVKSTFGKHSEVYIRFLEITQDIREDRFDINIIIKRVTQLFQGHARLIDGFNLFLPPGYTMPAEDSTAQPFLSSSAAEEI